ncbi:RutC family protein [Caballeronia arvi]|uniref:RutC family protein n=1 Tax=Caballeronia arvi TaxID=1777135 RepID=A0A158J2D0_9BURK|nr:RidA family protein [Caballeronia arvi]SAL63034.1 RutC family protein [Caballeronia arvi]
MVQSMTDIPADVATQETDLTGHRKSFTIEGIAHKFPVPNASRIGNLIVSSAIHAVDPVTRAMPDDLVAQCALVFANMQATVEAAGGSTDDIIKMTVYLRDRGNRGPLNDEWVRMFPDADSRPARHSQLLLVEGPSLIQCDFIAVVKDRT